MSMTREQALLGILAEECAETAQRASKGQRFGLQETQPGYGVNNERRLVGELADLLGVAEMLDLEVPRELIDAKKIKVERYLAYSRSLGQVE